MRLRQTWIFLLLAAVQPIAWSQTPVIFSGSVVDAASYQPGNTGSASGTGLAPASIVSIFGQHLAQSTQVAATVPLPTQLGGASVTVSGFAAPLFYVSPGQINFQMPSHGVAIVPAVPGIVVSTPAGASEPYLLGPSVASAFGIFTLDASGCGRGAVLNVASDGTTSINSPSNSVSPGDFISVYGTGLGFIYTMDNTGNTNVPPDGVPAPLSPLTRAASGTGSAVDLVANLTLTGSVWAGRAPGLIGVDQVNLQVPATAREGCAVPIQILAGGGESISQPVTISIHKGGGACADPPPAGYGQVTWQKTVTANVGSTTESDTLTVSLQASPGKRIPTQAPAPVEGFSSLGLTAFGPSCPLPGYRSLTAGAVAVQGPAVGPVQTSVVPLTEGQASGLTVYQATLPAGSIQPGSFSVSASGGGDVGAFQSAVRIGSGIQVTTPLAGGTFSYTKPLTVNWTGGDPGTWVTFTLVNHTGAYDYFRYQQARASDGTATMETAGGPPASLWIDGGHDIEIILEVTPDPLQITAFSAPGLSLGGQHLWKYTYRFEGVTLNANGVSPRRSRAVTASNPNPRVTITLKRGAAVPIRIDDPGQLLVQHEGKTPGAGLLVSVSGPGLFFRLVPLVSRDTAGRNYQIVIPFNTALTLIVHPSFYHVSDANGARLPGAASTKIPLLVTVEFRWRAT